MKIKDRIAAIIKSPNKILYSTLCSMTVTFFFALYNGVMGIIMNDSWGMSISIYFLCLTIARISALCCELKYRQNKLKTTQKNAYIGLSVFMFFIDLCLIAPISLLITNPKDFTFGLIPAIVVATYTTYKVTIAIINFRKVKKTNNIIFKYLRELSIVDALVSILTLQHTLIMVNGGMTHDMLILSCISSFVILLFVIIFSISQMIITTRKIKNEIYNTQNNS